MVRQVPRHAFDPEPDRELFASGVSLLVELLQKPPRKLQQLVQYGVFGLQLLERASVFEREHPLLRTGARTLGQAHLGRVLLGAAPKGENVEFPLGDLRVTMPGVGPNGQSGVTAWRDGWYGALMARDADTLEALRRASSTETLGKSAPADAYHYAWKDALVLADSQPDRARGFAERAITLTGPEFATNSAPGVPELAATVFPLLLAILEGNAANFNDALVAALEAHEARWAEEPQAPTGWIALGPLALACLAHDRGISIDVDSDYLLPALIRGS